MAKRKKKEKAKEEMSIMDAVDNLSGMAELDVPIKREGEERGVKKDLNALKTLDAQTKEETLSTVKGYKRLQSYCNIPYFHQTNLQTIDYRYDKGYYR